VDDDRDGSSECSGDCNDQDARAFAVSVFWYLVRARNSCGFGTYGFQSDGTERATPACF